MEKLITPFGEIRILIDGISVPYYVREGRKPDVRCPDVLDRYQITVFFVPDGKEHRIACVFEPDCLYEKTPESGERLKCQSFYNDQGFKMSMGLECESGYIDGIRISDEYDHDADYLENGMAYLINPHTKTNRYVFGIAWIDNVSWDDSSGLESQRDAQTWYGADPTLPLQT